MLKFLKPTKDHETIKDPHRAVGYFVWSEGDPM
jgi:hypothetical protein